MSLFDVIKYPIDERFSVEDLDRIPKHILIDWWCNNQSLAKIREQLPNITNITKTRNTTHHIYAVLQDKDYLSSTAIHNIDILQSLRKHIAEYEPI